MSLSKSDWPQRIICLTTETAETVFALGAGDRVVGVTGYATRPPEVREKEKVSAFTSVRMDKIRALKPDLILAFSDLQKDIVRDLVQEGHNVFVTNQRSLKEVGEAILAVGRLLSLEEKAEEICGKFYGELSELEKKAREFPGKIRVYFEEWDDPLISGIRWASEIIQRLGGEDIFEELQEGVTASERKVDGREVIRRNPEAILAAWCGKKVNPQKIRQRPGWEGIEAVRKNQIYEIKSADILQPGLSLLHGARQIFEIFNQVHVSAAVIARSEATKQS